MVSDKVRYVITGIILAGGKGSRMGGEDKGLLLHRGKPLYHHVATRLSPQVSRLYISANRNQTRYQQSGFPVLADTLAGFHGPLAGMLTAMKCINSEWFFFTLCDTPYLPLDIVQRLWQEKGDCRTVWVYADGRNHPALTLMHTSLAYDLNGYLLQGDRKVIQFLQKSGGRAVCFNDSAEAFFNINYPDDLIP